MTYEILDESKMLKARLVWFRDETDKAFFFEVACKSPGDTSIFDCVVSMWLPKSQVKTDYNHKHLWLTPWIAEKKEEEIAKEYGYDYCKILLEEEQS